MSQQLESLCSDIRSQGIVLNDDIARLTSCSTDDLLTTVMGHGATAGRPAGLNEMIRNEPDMASFLASAGSDEPKLVTTIRGLILNQCITSSLATQKHRTILAIDNYNAKLLDNIEKIQNTAVVLLRDCKSIVDAAEARANITVSTARKLSQETFENSMKVINEKIATLVKLDTRLVEVSEHVTTVYSDDSKSPAAVDSEVESLNRVQRGVETQMKMLVKSLVEHFSECQGIQRDTSTKDSVQLLIPDNLDQGKGRQLMDNVLAYCSSRIDMYYAIMPQLLRLSNDYNSNSGHFYKPPMISTELTTSNHISDQSKAKYLAQAKRFYTELIRKLPATIAARLKTTFNFGIDDAHTAICDLDDGPNAVFALVCMYTPQGEDHCQKLEQTFYSCVDKITDCRSDPRKVITRLRKSIVQAAEMQLELKWSLTGKLIVEDLSHDDHNMSKTLTKFAGIQPSDAQTVAKLDELFAAIESQCSKDVRHNDKGSTKRGLFVNGRLGKRDHEDLSKSTCKFGRECSNRKCERAHPDGRKIDSRPKHDTPDPKSKVPCKAEGCSATFLRENHRRILCKPCFDKTIQRNGGKVSLKDGTTKTFDVKVSDRSQGAVKQLVRKAYAAGTKRSRDKANDSDATITDTDEEAPDTRPAPLQVKRKRARAKAAKNAKPDFDSDANFKKFAANIGIDLGDVDFN